MTSTAAQLWFGRTQHTREKPFRRTFSHRIAMLEIDIDRLAEAGRLSRLFSVGKLNLISFRASDHGARSATVPLRMWAEARFAEAGIGLDGGTIRLLTFPRVLGYGFAPISLWLGHGPDGDLRGAIYEVHNTFGETHSYVSALNPECGPQRAEKELFVSPFFDVTGDYRFGLRRSDGATALTVENISADGRHHVASLMVTPRKLASAGILKWLVTMPISGLGVMIAIHWQAFQLWRKGAGYRDKPEPRARQTTLARPEKMSADAQADLRKRA
jgi:DUF1365 family protein